jgi:hypothetical protein
MYFRLSSPRRDNPPSCVPRTLDHLSGENGLTMSGKMSGLERMIAILSTTE